MADSVIQQKSFGFALMSIELYKVLQQHGEYMLSTQFFYCSTSIDANVREATTAQTAALKEPGRILTSIVKSTSENP